MTKDYAKRVYLANQKPKPSRLKKTWLIAALMLITLCIGYVFYVKHKKPDALLLAKISAEAKAVQTEAKTLEQQAVHFEFYDQLPNMKVKIAEGEPPAEAPLPPVKATAAAAAAISPAEAAAAAKSAYIVELGLFPDSSSAGQLRLSLLLSGIETEVSKIKDNGKVIYRVMQGPFVSFSEAKSSQQKLRRKGFDSEIKTSN